MLYNGGRVRVMQIGIVTMVNGKSVQSNMLAVAVCGQTRRKVTHWAAQFYRAALVRDLACIHRVGPV